MWQPRTCGFQIPSSSSRMWIRHLQVSWLMSTVTVTSDVINLVAGGGGSAPVTCTSSMSPLTNRTTCSPSALVSELVAMRPRPGLYVMSLLVPSGFLDVIQTFCFYMLADSENHAPPGPPLVSAWPCVYLEWGSACWRLSLSLTCSNLATI